MSKKNYSIFLDDKRTPDEAYFQTNNPVYINPNKNWIIVRNYDEFERLLDLQMLEGNKLISVSLDHDLCDFHETIPFEQVATLDTEGLMEKTGYDCAVYLTQFLDQYDMPIPGIICHSKNPAGKERITEHLLNWMDTLE